MVCAGEGQITLAPVGAGHAVYTGDPHIDTHTADPGMQTLRGAAICGLARVFGWHHLVLPGKPFGPRTEPVKGYYYFDSRQIAIEMTTQVLPPLTWHIYQIIVDVFSFF